LGLGNGSFSPGPIYNGAGGWVLAGDFNGDGRVDLVGGPPPPDKGTAELLGNGDGTFQPVITYPSGDDPFMVGDFNGDNRLDLLLFGEGSPAAIVMLNTGPMQFSPSSAISFPAQLIGTQSKSQTVTLTNSGTSAITIRSMKTSGPFQTSTTCGSQLAMGASCSVTAAFAPLKAGGQNGGVTLLDSASSKPQFIELYGSATPVETSPSGLQFGKQKVGTQSPPKVVTVTNLGTTPVTFQGVSFNGPDNHDFSEADNCKKQTIAPQGRCTVTVTFTPGKTGSETANLHIRPDLGTVDPEPLLVRGTGD
jgi:hypothetical protein